MSKSPPPPTPNPLTSPPPQLLEWKILILVTAYNSLSQRVVTHLKDTGFSQISIQFATSDEDMIKAVTSWEPVVVVCPFLTKRVPDVIWKNVMTLILHPGPPGDAGPSALDWALLGDTGIEPDSSKALKLLLPPSISISTDNTDATEKSELKLKTPLQRSHWGVTFLQAEEHLDGGPIWAFDQFALPPITTITKSSLYQGQVTMAAVRAIHTGLCRIYQQHLISPETGRLSLEMTKPNKNWCVECVSFDKAFMGGETLDRPLISASTRRIDFSKHAAEDVARIIGCGDSQPGATMSMGKSFIFVYDAHLQHNLDLIPASLHTSRGWGTWDDVPVGTILAQRSGALLFKTIPAGGAVAIWITHGRLPKPSKAVALTPKVTLAQAISQADGKRLNDVKEWGLEGFAEVEGMWQQVFVRSFNPNGALAQMVYFDFYNGACSTENCKLLLEALKWATHPDRGNVKLLCLMGGKYFSNGIALNIIEQAESPGQETWANINAIDDIVEFLLGDTRRERSPFMEGITPLCVRGIATVACLSGNAAAGGVALAAACDIVMASGSVVLNPAYRAMGLHGSEFHSWSYLKRSKSMERANHLLRDMLPMSAEGGKQFGLVDIILGDGFSSREQIDAAAMKWFQKILESTNKDRSELMEKGFACAPWTTSSGEKAPQVVPKRAISLVSHMTETKRLHYKYTDSPPLVHYRNEELSQMLLDCFHPFRSDRYHTRRFKFVRKVKTDTTPFRFAVHSRSMEQGGNGIPEDEEEMDEFDDAPNWVRGEEWVWAGLPTPQSMETSECLRIGIKSEEAEAFGEVDEKLEDDDGVIGNAIGLSGGGGGGGVGERSGLPPSPPLSDDRLSKKGGNNNQSKLLVGTPTRTSGLDQYRTIRARPETSSNEDIEDNTFSTLTAQATRHVETDIFTPSQHSSSPVEASETTYLPSIHTTKTPKPFLKKIVGAFRRPLTSSGNGNIGGRPLPPLPYSHGDNTKAMTEGRRSNTFKRQSQFGTPQMGGVVGAGVPLFARVPTISEDRKNLTISIPTSRRSSLQVNDHSRRSTGGGSSPSRVSFLGQGILTSTTHGHNIEDEDKLPTLGSGTGGSGVNGYGLINGYSRPRILNEGQTTFECYYNSEDVLGSTHGVGVGPGTGIGGGGGDGCGVGEQEDRGRFATTVPGRGAVRAA